LSLAVSSDVAAVDPSHDCPLCPRLHDFVAGWRLKEPSWFNGPVPTFVPLEGPESVRLLIVGLAPGLRGANRTGRPFTGDYAGDLLYRTLKDFGFAEGNYEARSDDGLRLVGTAITNAVRCVPPENKPLPAEIGTCRQFLTATIAALPRVEAILSLGAIAHQSVVRALQSRVAAYPFKHGAQATIARYALFSSYHCSRYNTNTGVLTEAMFASVFSDIRALLDK
jgi:uracil-DNA glycosylase family 4